MHLSRKVFVTFVSPSSRCAKVSLRGLTPGFRKYATHNQTSQSFSQSLDTGPSAQQRSRTSQQYDTVGPFTLGISPGQMRNSGEKVKKWSELSASGKVGRATVRTTNFTVIFLGAGLSAIILYALTSELFSKNSPTVLYGDACERIKASSQVKKYFPGQLIFHNNPPSAFRPRHRNRQVNSQVFVDSTGREHLLLNFYVQGKSHDISNGDAESYLDSISGWAQSQATSLSTLTIDDSISWSKDLVERTKERGKELFRWLSGAPAPRIALPPSTVAGTTMQPTTTSSAWSFAGLFSGLKGKSATSSDAAAAAAQAWTEGEVHADLVRNDAGYFVFRYLMIDIPHSRARSPQRVFVERGPGVNQNEPIIRWNGH